MDPRTIQIPIRVPSYQACVEAGKKLMNWNWHATGAKKLPDGRMHGASFRYQMCPRHSFSGYNSKLELKNGKVHMGTQGCCTGIYAVEGNAMVVAEELGLKYEDISIDFDYKETFCSCGRRQRRDDGFCLGHKRVCQYSEKADIGSRY